MQRLIDNPLGTVRTGSTAGFARSNLGAWSRAANSQGCHNDIHSDGGRSRELVWLEREVSGSGHVLLLVRLAIER